MSKPGMYDNWSKAIARFLGVALAAVVVSFIILVILWAMLQIGEDIAGL